MKKMSTWGIPAASFAAALVLSIVSGPGLRLMAHRAAQEPTCFAQASVLAAAINANAYTFEIPSPVQIRVDAQDDSKIKFGASLSMTVQVHVAAEKPSTKTMDFIIALNPSFKPKSRDRSYKGAVHKPDNFDGFEVKDNEILKDAQKLAIKALHDFNKSLPEDQKAQRFPIDGATASITAIAANPPPSVTMDGTYVCTGSGLGSFTPASTNLTMNLATGTGTKGPGGLAGNLP